MKNNGHQASPPIVPVAKIEIILASNGAVQAGISGPAANINAMLMMCEVAKVELLAAMKKQADGIQVAPPGLMDQLGG